MIKNITNKKARTSCGQRNLYLFICLFGTGILNITNLQGQTMPTPQTVPYSQNFSALAASATVYPAGWQGWNLSIAGGSSNNFRTSAPEADNALIASATAATTTAGGLNYNGKIGFLSNAGGNDAALCLALVTTGITNVLVAYDAMTIRNPYNGTTNTRTNMMTLQYRVGTSGNFTTLSSVVYQANTTTQTSGTTPQNVQNKSIVLPAACNNQPIVQIRWVQKDIAGEAGSRPSFAVDNISVTQATGCAGPPTAGTAVSTSSTACPAISFTLSLNGATVLSGITYQWQSSPDNITYTNIGGATSATLTTTESSTTYYQCIVSCGVDAATSTSVLVTATSYLSCYCTPSYGNGCGIDYISNVSFGTINNTTTCTGSTPSNLTFYNTPNPTLSQSVSYPISVSTGGDIEAINAWIDYNHNGVFDATETILSGFAGTNPATYTANVTIPNTSLLGQTRMRVRCRYNTAVGNGQACTAYGGSDYGEVEDYLITIGPAPSCLPASSVAATSVASNSASISFTCTSCAGSYIAEYGVAPFNTPGSAGTAGAGGTVITGAASPIALPGLTPNTTYDVYVRQNCTGNGNGYSANTTKITFSTPCVTSALPLTQGFNSTTLPSCWTQQFVTGTDPIQFVASSTNPSTTPQEGSDYVFWNSFSYSDPNETRLVSPPISTSGLSGVKTNFYWFYDNSNYTGAAYVAEGMTLQYSLNGTAWTDIQFVPRVLTGTNGWTLVSILLPAGALNQALVYLGFKFHSAFGNNCSLDNLNVFALTACSGPPAAATTISSLNPACYNTSFNLSLSTDYSTETGITYQWQSAPDVSGSAGTFANISGATSSTYAATQTVITWYRCRIRCTNTSQNTFSSNLPITTQLCYCTPVYSTGCANDRITNFAINTLSNNSGTACSASPPGYSIYGTSPANLTTTLSQNTSYISSITVATGNANGTGVAIWIDYNDNGVFDVTEGYNNGATKFASNSTGTVTVSIPAAAPSGQHRMRVRSARNTNSEDIDPCISGNANGEAEDYTVTIGPQVCVASPTAPSDGANICPETVSQLSWPAFSGATGYDVYFGTLNPATTLVSGNQTGTTYNTGLLAGGITYYWSVVPIGPGATTCATWSFSLKAVPDPFASNNSPVCEHEQIALFSENNAAGQTSTYSWSHSGYSSTAQNPLRPDATLAKAGIYTVVITNQFGCTASASTEVFVNENPVLSIVSQTDVSCNGFSDGEVEVSASGGTPTYIYSLDGVGSISGQYSGLAAGNYPLDVIDNNGCTGILTGGVTITEPDVLSFTTAVIDAGCAGSPAGSITVNATGGTPAYQYSNDNGGSFQASNNFPNLSAGSYQVIVTDAHSCITLPVTTPVGTAPDSDPPVYTFCPGNLSSCNPVSWTLPTATDNCGTVTFTSNHNPGETFPPGTTTVTYTADDSNGNTAPCSFDVTVVPTPTATISGSSTICLFSSTTVHIVFTGTGPWNYMITDGTQNIPATSTVNPDDVSITPNTGGSHTYTVTGLADANCGTGTVSGSASVTVNTVPANDTITAVNAPLSACPGDIAQITATTNAGPGVTFSWTKGNYPSVVKFSNSPTGTFVPGPFVTTGPSVYAEFHTVSGSGYHVCVNAVNDCGPTNHYKCAFIRGSVSTPATITGSATACPSDTKSYSCSLSGGASVYTWSFNVPGAVIANNGTPNVDVTFPTFTTGQLCVTAALGCTGALQSPPRCKTITVSTTTPGPITGAAKICPGDNNVAFSIVAMPGATSYNWFPPTGGTIVETPPYTNSIHVNFPSSYTSTHNICVSTNSACGTSGLQCKTVGSYVPNQPGAISGPASGACNGTFQYSIAAVAGATSYNWTIPAAGTNLTGQGTTSIQFSLPSGFTSGFLSVTANTNLCSPGISAFRTITVSGAPVSPGTITYIPNPVCANATGVDFQVAPVFGASSYNWVFPAGVSVVSNLGNEQIVNWGTTGGTVSVTAINTCGSGSRSTNITINCREEEAGQVNQQLTVYPNPAHDKIIVGIYVNVRTSFNMKLRDISGRVILSENHEGAEGVNAYEMDLKSFAKGVYMLEVQSGSDTWNRKVVIE